jgi:hypothetical protein
LARGNSVRLRYGVVLFAGSPGAVGLEQIYKRWSAKS